MESQDGSALGLDAYFDSDGAVDDAESQGSAYDDGNDGDGDQSEQQAARAQAMADLKPIPGGGALLEEPSAKKLFTKIEKEADRQLRLRKNRAEAAKHWDLVRGGCQFSILEKSEDLSIYKQLFPPGTDSTPQPIPNKVDDLCSKIVSQLLVDPFLPNPKPDGDSDRNRGAADLTKKFLRANATPDNCNDAELFREALNTNMTKASAYAIVRVDPVGGGWRPKQVKAHPHAVDATNPLYGPKLDATTGQPIVIHTAQGPTPITEKTSDPVLRYVTDDGQFTTDPSAAARQWMPKIKRKLLTPPQVCTLPPSANVFEAEGLIVIMWETLGEAKRWFPVLATLTRSELADVTKWRPKQWKSIVPEALRLATADHDGAVTDDTLVFWYHRFCRISPDYVDGADVAVNGGGGGTLFKRDTLREDVELEDGTTVPVLMVPPVTQWVGLHDTVGGDPNGKAPVSRFGGANEIYAHIYTSILESIDQGLHPNIFLPATSPVSREDMVRRDGRPIEILTPDDKPIYEEPREIPAFTPQILERIEGEMNSLAGTNETSNGLDSSYSTSGVAKQVAINQAKVALAQQYQNFVAGTCYYWLICTQQAQSRYTVPQMVKLSGQDSAYKQRWWVGSDLTGVSAIAVEPGSGTMMTGPEKANYLGTFQDRAWLTKEQAGEQARAALSDDLGLPPDVHEEAMSREIGEWVEGPPKGWEDDYRANQQVTTQYQTAIQQRVAALVQQGADPQAAQQQAQRMVPPPQPKPLSSPFLDRPSDVNPLVAAVQEQKLSRLQATVDYTKHSPMWRSLVDQRWTKAFHNAGGLSIDDQRSMQAGTANAPPSYQQFVSDTSKKVMAVASMDIAKAIATLEGLGPKNTDVSAPITPPAPDNTPTPGQQGALEALARSSDQAHGAVQNALDRQHEASENAKDRALELEKHAMTGQTKLRDSLMSGALRARQAVATAAARPAPAAQAAQTTP